MRVKHSTVIISLFIATLSSQSALPKTCHQYVLGVTSFTAPQLDSIESLVPREGLEFYLEVRSGGLALLAQTGRALPSLSKMLMGDGKVGKNEVSAFLIRNMGTLSRSRIALVGYGPAGTAAVVSLENLSEAENLKADLVRSLTAQGPSSIAVVARGNALIAGSQPAVDRLSGSERGLTLADDQGFITAQSRFATDPLFAFIELSGILRQSNAGSPANAAYTAGMMAALNSMPYAIGIGGSIDGEVTSLRALLLYGNKQKAGLFSSIFSSGSASHLSGSSFVSPDSDLFIAVSLDWEKIYEGIETMFSTMTSQASSASGGAAQTIDLFTMIEASLGFSIKDDLIPTLGGELAFSIDGLDRLITRTAPSQQSRSANVGASKTPRRSASTASPKFLLIIALRDPERFEKLISQLIARMSKGPSQLERLSYRGTIINFKSGIAYTITNKFFVMGTSPVEIRRAIDAHASGQSLANDAGFRSSVGASRSVMMQAYISGAEAERLFGALRPQGKTSPESISLAASTIRTPLGLVVTPDSQGVMVETRLPTEVAMLALNWLAATKPAQVGAATGTTTESSTPPVSRGPDGRRVPKLTTDDIKNPR